MKKSIAAFIALTGILTACSPFDLQSEPNEPNPSATVMRSFNAAKNGDFETYLSCIEPISRAQVKKQFEELSDDSFKEYFSILDRCEIINQEVNGDVATVKTKISLKNGQTRYTTGTFRKVNGQWLEEVAMHIDTNPVQTPSDVFLQYVQASKTADFDKLRETFEPISRDMFDKWASSPDGQQMKREGGKRAQKYAITVVNETIDGDKAAVDASITNIETGETFEERYELKLIKGQWLLDMQQGF